MHYSAGERFKAPSHWNTPLTQAIKQGDLDIVNVLLDAPGINLSKADRFDGSPLAIAIAQTGIKNPNPEALDILKALRKKAPLKNISTFYWHNGFGYHPIHRPEVFAIAKGSCEAFAEVFKDPSDPNSFESLVNAVSRCCVHTGSPYFEPDWPLSSTSYNIERITSSLEYFMERALRILVKDLGIHVNNVVDTKGTTLLIKHAGVGGSLRVFNALMSSSYINVNKADNNGRTPLIAAVEANCFSTAMMNSQEHLAARSEKKKSVQMLLESPNIDLNAVNNQGETALAIAVFKGDMNTVEELLTVEDIKVDVLLNGGSLEEWAENCKYSEIQELLKQHQVNNLSGPSLPSERPPSSAPTSPAILYQREQGRGLVVGASDGPLPVTRALYSLLTPFTPYHEA